MFRRPVSVTGVQDWLLRNLQAVQRFGSRTQCSNRCQTGWTAAQAGHQSSCSNSTPERASTGKVGGGTEGGGDGEMDERQGNNDQ